MNADTWHSLKEIIADAMELAPEQRDGFIAAAAGGDRGLLSEARELLKFNDSGCIAVSDDSIPFDDLSHDPPSMLGPYRILRELGRGGSGIVYLAERSSPFHKLVAVKVLSYCVEELCRRFQVERQILAGLEHPSIARLLDGGFAPRGEPYLVVEYVDGLPLDRYCESAALSIRRRLELFRKVCAAVDYAHHQLVVHRDLKPANILVTPDGTPKLLDFGIAKLLSPEGVIGDTTGSITRFGLHPMTPEFASPEQVRGERVVTASDVYSLGVILYLLLAGRLPYQVRGQSVHDWTSAIVEQQPCRLKGVSHDLEAIVLRALRKEPAQRYPSAAALCDDLDAWLAGRPVCAADGALWYRANKFARRHTAVLAFGTLAFLSLTLGGGVAIYQGRVAVSEQQASEFNRKESERRLAENQKLVRTFLFDAADKLAARSPDLETRRAILQQAAEMVDSLAAEHSDNLGLPQDVALSYLHLSALQSDPEGAGPADPEGAQLSAIHAQRLLSRVVSRHPSDLNTRYLLALSYLRMGDAYFVGKEYQGAKDAYSESLQRFQTLSELGDRWRVLVRTDPPASQLTPYLIEQTNTPGNRLRSPSPLRAIWLLGRISALIGDTDRARETYLAGLSAFPIPVERPQDELLIEIAHANLLQGVGDCYASKNDFTQARAFYARAERIFEGLHAPSLAAERDRQSLLARLRDRVAVLGQHD